MPKPPGKQIWAWIPTIGLLDAIARHDTRGRQETIHVMALRAAEERNLDVDAIMAEADRDADADDGSWEAAHRE